MSDMLQDNLSTMNPADIGALKSQAAGGQGPMAGVSENTTIREFFGKIGIDVDGPVTQLKQFADSELSKADPLNKAEALAGGPGGAPPMPPGPRPGAGPAGPMPEGAPGIEGLMQ